MGLDGRVKEGEPVVLFNRYMCVFCYRFTLYFMEGVVEGRHTNYTVYSFGSLRRRKFGSGVKDPYVTGET